MADWHKTLKWLPPQDASNPFMFEALDCRSAVSALSQLISCQTESQSFSTLEKLSNVPAPVLDGGRAICGECLLTTEITPDNCSPQALDCGPGGKWRLELKADVIIACRRWTGQVIHIANYESCGNVLTVTHLTTDRDWSYGNLKYAAAEMEFLLSIYLAHTIAAFPMSPGLGRSDEAKIALQGWKSHGTFAHFAKAWSGKAGS